MESRKAWYGFVLATGLCVAVAGAARAQTAQSTPKPAATAKAQTQPQTNPSKLKVEGMVTRVDGESFEIEVLRMAKGSAGLAVGSRIRIQRDSGMRILRDGTYLKDGILKVGEKVQILGSIASAGSAPTYTARIIKVVQAAP